MKSDNYTTQADAATAQAQDQPIPAPAPANKGAPLGLLDLAGLAARVPLGERTLREEIKKRRIPSIRLPGGRRLLFHWPSVEAALLRYQRGGGIE